MALPQGIDFRATVGFVTDVSPNDFAGLGTTYPHTSAQGNTVGWESATANLESRDRTTGNIAQLAGINFQPNSGVLQPIFRINLPSAGSYIIRAAFGDASSAQTQYISIFDTASLITSLSAVATSGNSFADANGTVWAAAAWPSLNTTLTATFATTICRVKIGGGNAGANSTTIAYFYIESAAVAPSNGLNPTPFAKPGVGPNPARVGRQFAFMGSTKINPSRGIIAVGSSGGFGGGVGTSAIGSGA